MKRVFLILGAAFALSALAQTKVDQGAPGNQGPWPVRVTGGIAGPDGGAVIVQDLGCLSPVESVIVFTDTTDAGVIPAISNRRSINACVSPRSLGAPIVTCTIDGQLPTNALGSVGQQLQTGQCLNYTIGPTVNVRCLSDSLDAGLQITQCR